MIVMAMVLSVAAHAQEASGDAPATASVGGTIYVAEVDREDWSDLSSRSVSALDVVAGLFPEDLETADQRKKREACERIIQAGFKCMPPARSYTRYSLPGVNFAVGSALLPVGMKEQLRVFAEALKGRSASMAVIRIDGHADASGSAEANMLLSQRRAESARDFLVSLGASPALFVVQGFGSERLRNAADPTAAENRRVEIARQLAPAAGMR